MKMKRALLIATVSCGLAIGASGRDDIDAVVTNYMTSEDVKGLSLAIAKGNQLVYAKGYGDTGAAAPVGHDRDDVPHRQPVEVGDSGRDDEAPRRGRFGASGLNTKVFGPWSVFGDRYKPAAGYGSDLLSLELVHLLEHSAGFWGPVDPMFHGSGEGANDPYSPPYHPSLSSAHCYLARTRLASCHMLAEN